MSDAVTLVCVKFSRRHPTSSHPFGYGKYETVGALAVATLLLGSGVGIGHHSLQLLQNAFSDVSEVHAPTYLALGGAIASIGTKEALYQITMRVAQKVRLGPGTSAPTMTTVRNAVHVPPVLRSSK